MLTFDEHTWLKMRLMRAYSERLYGSMRYQPCHSPKAKSRMITRQGFKTEIDKGSGCAALASAAKLLPLHSAEIF